MHVWILTKRRLALLAGILVLSLFIGSLGAQGLAKAAVAQKKLVPIYQVDTSEKKVCLTFDAAWGDSDTQELIDILAKYDAKATFFVVGEWADKYPESVRALHNAGHSIQNHSDTHPHMPQQTPDQMRREIDACNDKIEALTGVRPILMRAPYGDYDNAFVTVTNEAGMYPIQWNIDSLDWKKISAADIRDRVVQKIQPGSILLFHNDVANTPIALPGILEAVQTQGYACVTVEELIYKDQFTIDATGKQCKE